MENQPPSIWKRIWRGPRANALWFSLVACAAFVVVYAIGASCRMGHGLELFVASLIFASALAVVGLLGLFFLRWVSCWRNFRRFLLGVACGITFIALVYVEENLRGKAAWSNFRREWEAKGEKFDWASFIPPQVSDEQNFGALPLWTNMLRYEWDPVQQREVWRGREFAGESFKLTWSRAETNHPGIIPPTGDWQQQRRTDLAPWQAYYRATNAPANNGDGAPAIPVAREFPVAPEPQSPAADVLLALSRNEAELKPLRAAVTRPYVRYPLRYDQEDVCGILLPHLAKGKAVAQLCQLHAIAALQNGQTDLAFDDIRLGLKLTDSSGGDFLLISHLVRIAISQLMLVPVWEGLADHKWSEAQLAELERLLARTDFLADHLQGIRTERAGAVSVGDYLLRRRSFFGRNVFEELGMESNGENPGGFDRFCRNAAFRAVPSGWFYQNDLTVARLHQELVLPIVDEKNGIIRPGLVRTNNAELDRRMEQPSIFNVLARMMMPALGRLAEKSAYGQSGVDLARVACALERHWLATGAYPESLEALTPKYLPAVPHDVINGLPLHYRRTGDGRFVLYSVGWNEKDDGGTIVVGTQQNNAGMRVPRREQGDWVWSYAPVPVTLSESSR